MVCIYCITDWNGLNYIGSTCQKLWKRLSQHKTKAKIKNGKECSSEKLDLYNCIIYRLETCSEDDRMEKEKYWINKYECVNVVKYTFEHLDSKQYYEKNKERINYLKRVRSKVKN